MKMNKKDYKKLKENVFDLMCGEVDVALSVGIKNEFEDGSYCDRIYQEIYDRIEKICSDKKGLMIWSGSRIGNMNC